MMRNPFVAAQTLVFLLMPLVATLAQRDADFPPPTYFMPLEPLPLPPNTNMMAQIKNGTFWYQYTPGTFTQLNFITGVNLGAAKPGYNPGDLPLNRADYLRYFEYCRTLQIQILRIYTTLSSDFYLALWEHNLQERSNFRPPILILHGIWTPEPLMNGLAVGSDAFDPRIVALMKLNIKTAVQAVHGFGEYYYGSSQVSQYSISVAQYVLGWVMGTEWSPETVNVTNVMNSDTPPYSGTFIEASSNASPFESWLAFMLDVLTVEDQSFGWQHPVTFTNWVTTDPIFHILEPPIPYGDEDWQSVDATHVRTKTAWTAGYFVNFHAYPYYPAFLTYPLTEFPLIVNMSNYPEVKTPGDPYATYIERLRSYFEGYVLVITEVGLPTSWGSSQIGFQGRNHGDLNENAQAQLLVELLQMIYDRGLQGWMIFELVDEWFKINWNTEAVDMDRQFWHNYMSSEQFFGLIACESQSQVVVDGSVDDWQSITPIISSSSSSTSSVPQLKATYNAGFLFLMIERPSGVWTSSDRFAVSFDSIPEQGSTTWNQEPDLQMGHAADAIMLFQDNELTMMINSAADLYKNLWAELNDGVTDPAQYAKDYPGFETFSLLIKQNSYIGKGPIRYYSPHELIYSGNFVMGTSDITNDSFNNLAGWISNGNVLEVRIPWMMLGFDDPSEPSVYVFDGYSANMSYVFPGVNSISIQSHWLQDNTTSSAAAYEEAPSSSSVAQVELPGWTDYCYCERYKKSAPILATALGTMMITPLLMVNNLSSFALSPDFTYCECVSNDETSSFEIKGFIIFSSFIWLLASMSFVAFILPLIDLMLHLLKLKPVKENTLALLPRIILRIIAGAFAVAIIIGFWLNADNNSNTDLFSSILSVFSERTYTQSIFMVIIFILLMTWDSCELLFALTFIPWKSISPSQIYHQKPQQQQSNDVNLRSTDGLFQPRKISRKKFYFVVACHNSSNKIDGTIKQLLKHVTPQQVVIADNGSSSDEIQRTSDVAKRLSDEFQQQHPLYTGSAINIGNITEGSKTLAQLSACYNLAGTADMVTLMDDDTFLPDDFNIDEVIGLFESQKQVHCVGYPLRAARRSLYLEAFEDMEYLISSFMKVTQAHLGTALFASGAMSTWRTEIIIDVLFRHDTMHNGDDLQQGLILHALDNKAFFLDPLCIHPGNYKVDMSANVVITDVPIHWIHTTDLFSFAKRCNCGEPSLLHQRGKGWDVSRHRFALKYARMLFSSANFGRHTFWAKLIATHDLLVTINDYVSYGYMIYIFLVLDNRLLVLFSLIFSWAFQSFVGTLFNLLVLTPKGICVPLEIVFLYPMMYKLPCQLILRLYAILYNILYYVPFVRNKATIKHRLRDGDTKPMQNVFAMSMSWQLTSATSASESNSATSSDPLSPPQDNSSRNFRARPLPPIPP